MKRHLAYLKYVLRHKGFVFRAGLRLNVPLWQLVVHDWHKFTPSEWGPYARTFYRADGTKKYEPDPLFDQAWNSHQKRGKHHWQYWLLTYDKGTTKPLRIPRKYVLEMVADWSGAGWAISGNSNPLSWYLKNETQIQLHPDTRAEVRELLYLGNFHHA